MRLASLFLVGAALLVAAPSAVFGASGCSNSDSWDYLMLTLQWPPAACEQFGCKSSNTEFTLHGLWPNNNDGSYPCYCSNEAFDPSKLSSSTLADMNKFWPSYNGANDDFWSHEWGKHGTCAAAGSSALATQELYFSKTLAIRAAADVSGRLMNSTIIPSSSKTYDLATIMNIVNGGKLAIADCQNADLASIEICFDKNFNPVDCTGSPNGNCPNQVRFLDSTP